MGLVVKTPKDLDVEAQAARFQAERDTARAYLNDTDWIVVRYAETGKEIPADFLERRAAARARLGS